MTSSVSRSEMLGSPTTLILQLTVSHQRLPTRTIINPFKASPGDIHPHFTELCPHSLSRYITIYSGLNSSMERFLLFLDFTRVEWTCITFLLSSPRNLGKGAKIMNFCSHNLRYENIRVAYLIDF